MNFLFKLCSGKLSSDDKYFGIHLSQQFILTFQILIMLVVESIEIKKVGAKYTYCIHTNAISMGSVLEFDTPQEALAAAEDVLESQQLSF